MKEKKEKEKVEDNEKEEKEIKEISKNLDVTEIFNKIKNDLPPLEEEIFLEEELIERMNSPVKVSLEKRGVASSLEDILPKTKSFENKDNEKVEYSVFKEGKKEYETKIENEVRPPELLMQKDLLEEQKKLYLREKRKNDEDFLLPNLQEQMREKYENKKYNNN
ncbi:hypothetical protein GW932_00490 [archaeon]|nr:hypothetical protein [archaeon]